MPRVTATFTGRVNHGVLLRRDLHREILSISSTDIFSRCVSMKAEEDGERDIESNSNLLDPPIEALDKATASTKISSEQCTWPDSDRVKCHRASSLRPAASLRRPGALPYSTATRSRFRYAPRHFLRSLSLPSFLFLLPHLFSFSYDRRRSRSGAAEPVIRGSAHLVEIVSTIAYRAAEDDRAGSSHRRSSSPSYVTHTGVACIYL
jgi:hypothetical protein